MAGLSTPTPAPTSLVPPELFTGPVTVYSTCRRCAGLMYVFTPEETVHPCCDPRPTLLESLRLGYASAVKAASESPAGTDDGGSTEHTLAEIQKLERQPPDLASAAVAYAEDGWSVFPLGERSHKPAIPSPHGKDDAPCTGGCGKAGHGFHDATSNPERIARWWGKHPRHNIGLATGLKFDVIDVDPKNDGIPAFLELLNASRLPEIHGIAVTRSGGLHLYVQPRNIRSRLGFKPGIDYKAQLGYVVAPPSVMTGGKTYTWLTVPSPSIRDIVGTLVTDGDVTDGDADAGVTP